MVRLRRDAVRPGARLGRPAGWWAALAAGLLVACGGDGGGSGPDGARLQLNVDGLPSGTPATVMVTGPNGFNRAVTTSSALTDLPAGVYSITAANTENDTARYAPVPLTQNVTLAEGQTTPAAVAYAVSTGRIAVSITGLPGGVSASVLVVRSPSFAQTLSGSATLSKLAPGLYTITADTIENGGITYPGTPRTQALNLVAGYTPVEATVRYGPQPGSLRVTVAGLPVAFPAAVTVTGPGGFNQAVTQTTTLFNLEAGSYTISAASVANGGDSFDPTPTEQQRAVADGAQAEATVTYASTSGATLNLSIGRFYITQAVQKPNNSVPLVAGRPALVRVFILANEANTAQPQVRVRFFQGATEVLSTLVGAQVSSVPIFVSEGNLANSWDVELPAGFLAPGMTVEVAVDPANTITESAESDNSTFPPGQSGALTVTNTPSFKVTFVPVTQSGPGLTGSVSDPNLYLDFTRRVHPLQDIEPAVRSPYVTATTLQGGEGGAPSWQSLLNELEAAKAADGFTGYYYGVVKVTYNSGIVGIGYVPFFAGDAGARVALGVDAPSIASVTAAHEWGHNFGRGHAPCGVPQSGDWPADALHANASIAYWGWDRLTGTLLNPAIYRDVMSYCSNEWISDYTTERVLNFRSGVSYATAAAAEGLLVWGRVEDGRVVLEPAFAVTAPATPSEGDWEFEALDDAGVRVATRRFSAAVVADLPGEPRSFAFVVPMDEARRGRLAALRVSGPTGSAERRTAAVPPGARVTLPVPAVERAGDRTRLRWDPSRFGAAMVRDAATGEVLAIVREGGEASVVGARGDLEVTFSDGVRSARARVAR